MRWDLTEYLLKGLYLGVFVSLGLRNPDAETVLRLAIFMVGGLVLALVSAAYHKIRDGLAVKGRWAPFVLFLLLENPGAVYTGVMVGLLAGAYPALSAEAVDNEWDPRFYGPLFVGPLLGILFWYIRSIPKRDVRQLLGMGLVSVFVIAPLAVLNFLEIAPPTDQMLRLSALTLLGIVGFYLLTFSSLIEESEVEIASLCGAMGVGLWLFFKAMGWSALLAPAVIPLLIYYVYSRQVLPHLRVFKHALRGLSYKEMGQYRLALISLNRALKLNPQHQLTRSQLWELHRILDADHFAKDPAILQFINYDICLERVSDLLLQDQTPSPKQIADAQHLLKLIAEYRPDLTAGVYYWRTLAFLYLKDLDQAEQNLTSLLRAPAEETPARQAVLFRGWHLALMLHPEMKRRVGSKLLQFSDRNMEAIAALEREIAQNGNIAAALDLRTVVYSELSENDYSAAVPQGQAAAFFNHDYVREMGLSLLDHPAQWQRGCEYLRIAARGLPALAPSLYIQVAHANEKHDNLPSMWSHYFRAMVMGRALGAAKIPAPDQKAFFEAVKAIGDRAKQAGQIDLALEAFKFLSQSDFSSRETWRTLADLFEQKKDPWTALHCTEHGLTENPKDADFKERKDRYYYSITPEELKARWENVQRWFDAEYCIGKASTLVEAYRGELDYLDWAAHLADLAVVALPTQIRPKFLQARILRIRGETSKALEIMEGIRQNKPAKFQGEEEDDAWHLMHRILGDIYLDTNPAEAVKCFRVFRDSHRAGADTSYKLGLAYEKTGENRKAAACFEEVMVFTEHPLFYEARDAMDRVKRAGNPT